MKLLEPKHNSPETAYLVDDYPYGFKLRCKIRYWLEYNPKKGFRFCSQTTNPKKGDIWNKPKKSTYCLISAAMFLDEDDHVQWSGLSEYSSLMDARNWKEIYQEGCSKEALDRLNLWIQKKLEYELAKAEGRVKITINGQPV